MPSLSDLYWKDRDRPVIFSATVITLSSLGTVDLAWQGTTLAGINYLGSYSPTAGDVVAVIFPQSGSMLVLGKYGTGAGGLGPNLLPNPSFELGVPGAVPSSWSNFWSGTPGHQKIDNTVAHTGGQSAKFDLTGVPFGSQVLMNVDAVSVDAGATYRVGAWYKANAADASHLTAQVTIVTAATAVGAQPFGVGSNTFNVSSTSPGTPWVEVAGTRTIPATDNYARVFVYVITTSGFTVANVWCDDVSLRHQ
jgi:hypothetical protein